MKAQYDVVKDIIKNSTKVVITSHLNPDGDALGSSLALYHFLCPLVEQVNIVLPNRAPGSLTVLPGYEKVKFFCHHKELSQRLLKEADVIFALDYHDISSRIGDMGDFMVAECASTQKILIDHHLAPDLSQYKVSFSDVTSSSTAMLVYRFIENISGSTDAVTEEIAISLYVGMMTDTGNFSYGNLNGELFRAVAVLVEKGVVPTRVSVMLNNSQSESRLRLIGYCIYDKMVVLPEIQSAYISLSKEELDRFNFKEGDIEGVVNMPLSIEGIYNTALFMEREGLIKISLRSQDKEGIDMNEFARNNYIGGGHKNAAGGKFYGTIQQTIDIFVEGMQKIFVK